MITQLAKDLINIKLDDDTTNKILEIFYDVMRRRGIREGVSSMDGVAILKSTPEWVMCQTLFLERIKNLLEYKMLFDVPNDLACYDSVIMPIGEKQ